MKFFDILKESEQSQDARIRVQILDTTASLKGLRADLQEAKAEGDDALVEKLRKRINEQKNTLQSLEQEYTKKPVSEAQNKDKLRDKLVSLKAQQADMPKNPSSQEGYDALDDIRWEIERIEKQLKGK